MSDAGGDIRPARPGEAEALARLIDAAYQPYRDQGIRLPDVSAGLPEAIAAGQVFVLDDGSVIGVLQLSLAQPEAHLINVAIPPEAQGRGVGGRLIRFALHQARAAGCAAINLATHKDLTGNIALYQHLGWQVVEQSGDKVVMRQAL